MIGSYQSIVLRSQAPRVSHSMIGPVWFPEAAFGLEVVAGAVPLDEADGLPEEEDDSPPEPASVPVLPPLPSQLTNGHEELLSILCDE
jgi:hypothetical protein